MQLRTNRKRKSTDLDDLGYEERPLKPHKKSYRPKISTEKDYTMDEVIYIIYLYVLSYKIVFKLFRS